MTGVTIAGVFVRINKYLAEGLVKTADLPTGTPGKFGRWKFDARTGALVDQGSNRSFRLGDRVEVCVSQVNLPARRMELLIFEEAGSKRASKALKPGEGSGGMGHASGAGFGNQRTGKQRRSAKSKRRDKGKADYRQGRKKKKG